tara:strand:- start:31 stop:642 length:612 start_codon:yes stop_codon:yes gene_type:complete
MQNGIIVPLSGAFIASAIGPTASDPQLDVSGATHVANTGSPVSLAATGGSGTGAVFDTVFTGSDMSGTTITATAGSGYKVGDVLTIAGNATNFTGSIVLTVIEEDLLGDESEGYISSPGAGGFWNCVFPPDAGDSYGFLIISQIESDHERDWKVTITGGSADNHNDVAIAFDKAMVKAAQRPNENITVTGLPSGVTVSKVELT